MSLSRPLIRTLQIRHNPHLLFTPVPRATTSITSRCIRPCSSRLFGTTAARQVQVPQNMKAILIKNGTGHADDLYLGQEPTPEPGNGQVQVKIKNFGLNRMDILQREGKYPLPPQASKTILGVEFSGVVTQLGEGVTKWKEGDEVFGLSYGGAYAEYIVSPEIMLLAKPKKLSWVEAASIPEVWMTATQGLTLEAPLKEGQNVLIHAGASGVGIAAIQIALHALGAAKVFTTCGTDEKVESLKQLGHSDRLHVINYRTQNFEEEIKKVTNGVDLIIDFIGTNYFLQNVNVLRLDGTLYSLAFMSGAKFPEGASMAPFLGKRLTFKGSTLRSRSPEYQAKLLKTFEEKILPKILDDTMAIKVHEVYPWSRVTEAHKAMEGNKNSGKIVLEVTE
ncbi:quinone oxidoreductase [Cryptococcus deuterogattii 99/473]|uniref:Quinone oxidoreductase n=2 Tax=Cryptococcus deuterogattii TaxID=1859096 RepID=A0A0D0UUQ1_9TREE|nr:quinone oxidoreductase [Cryptococcus deuterogattii LA55]KIR36543.1 quinone oxidoreductase [Cryptococcus deuterogattii MMRL2647]KIR38946.1 quinone oxidoreductase [Cryptococcus deuterogattii Ram5]KIR75973.1 quinone oxidoreductase [Cryptococcus deuterogattii CA1014]KIR95916.1 quinone oxidoreductase [Cryptococcus deuterogattii CBS 10090]KIY58859.1 quinone oxidoreductase [Cryptococcus deuterogattii 99/473]